jgi:hypothetical protein
MVWHILGRGPQQVNDATLWFGKLMTLWSAQHWGNSTQRLPKKGSRLSSTYGRKGRIEQDKIGLKFLGFLNAFRCVRGFAANCKWGVGLNKRAQETAYVRIVVDNENAGHKRSSLPHLLNGRL